MNDTKAKIYREQNKAKISSESVYALWTDEQSSLQIKIAPQVGRTTIKLVSVKDDSVIGKVSRFCGLPLPPRRKNWKGFELVTHLEKRNKFEFRRGIVHMPRAARLTYVDLVGSDNLKMLLKFYFFEEKNGAEIQRHIGSLVLRKISQPC